MSDHPTRTRLHATFARLGCSPTELVALVVLVAGAVVVLAVLFLRTPGAGEPGAPPVIEPLTGAHEHAGAPSAADVTSTVHVAGAVGTPGLYELPSGSRVADALEAAGGAQEDALLDDLNLARRVADGERLLVVDEAAAERAATAGAWRPDGTLDLNRASAVELEELPGVGPVLAGRIVGFREDNGPFAQAGDLRDVPGIGEAMFDALAELVGT